jgi:uncharacterized protein (TIRG00374 family)
MSEAPVPPARRSYKSWLRLLGPVLLIILLVQLDVRQVVVTISRADLALVGLSTILILPLIAIKTLRWQVILRAQSIHYRFLPAYVAYFASLFIGFLTPGRLGEFTKAFYVWQDGKATPASSVLGSPQPVSFARSFSGVIADRIFDLGAVILVSALALANLANVFSSDVDLAIWGAILGVGVLLAAGLVVFLNPRIYTRLQDWGLRMGSLGRKLFAEDGWVTEIRLGLSQLRVGPLLVAIGLTAVAYGLYFWQCYLLALALDMKLSYTQVSFVVALGGLVTLLPVSISGLGTREATMVAYLGAWGVPAEAAVGFSLLVFVAFYLGGSLIGAAAWLWHPTPGLKAPRETG